MGTKYRLNDQGMTLIEVIVAFAIFAVAATILAVGFNGALKIMGNSNQIKDASQSAAGELELNGAEKVPGTIDFKIVAMNKNGGIVSGSEQQYSIAGNYQTATSTKSDGLEITQKIFEGNAVIPEPAPPVPDNGVPEIEAPTYNWTDWVNGTGNAAPVRYEAGQYVRYNGVYYRCVITHDSYGPTAENDSNRPGTAPNLWVRVNAPGEEWMDWTEMKVTQNNVTVEIGYGKGARVKYDGKYWVCQMPDTNPTIAVPGTNASIWKEYTK